ncbi:OmpA family protein [Altererythrobacter aquiaggeris]|uniref:OmpA family protein n=1 Tax=Aestuarierythrobacter aquiaggeris TaxID=1898396 RepID=UPI003019106A
MTGMVSAMATAIAIASMPAAAAAQDIMDTESLMALGTSDLRDQIQMRYDAALAASRDGGVINADDPRYIWAISAKAHCGIALGYLKSSNKDRNSISKCNDAYQRMMITRVVTAPPRPPVTSVPQEVCDRGTIGTVFFDFDSAMPGAGSGETIDYITTNVVACGWAGFEVVGHTDRSGSDAYNIGLSQRRAAAVVDMLANGGIARGAIATDAEGESQPRVPTADGVREPQNRRVEIKVQ